MRLLLVSWTPSQSFIILCLTKTTALRQTVKMRTLFEFETLLPELSGKSCILQHLRVTCRRYVRGTLLQVQCQFSLVYQGTHSAKIVAKLHRSWDTQNYSPSYVCLTRGYLLCASNFVRYDANLNSFAFVFLVLTYLPSCFATACHCTFQTRWKEVERREHRRWVLLRLSGDTIRKRRTGACSPLFIWSCSRKTFALSQK